MPSFLSPLVSPLASVLVATVVVLNGELLRGQRVAVAIGQDAQDCRLEQHTFARGAWTRSVLRPAVKLLPIASNDELLDEASATHRPRRIERGGVFRIECPTGDKLLAFENTQQQEYGLLFARADGTARIVYTSVDALDSPMSMAPDGRHVCFARGTVLTIVRLDGGVFPSTGTSWRTCSFPDNVDAASITAAGAAVFCALDDGRVFRLPYGDGAVAQDLTPPGTASWHQARTMALSADGTTAAFLRGPDALSLTVWVVRASGPAFALGGPARAYRPPAYLPFDVGVANLVLSADGSRLLATEDSPADEDELHLFATTPNAPPWHLTGNQTFAAYIGAHILPRFRGQNLWFASGHQGEFDWYLATGNGQIANITQTGAPEPPFLVGSLAVEGRVLLGDGSMLATDRLVATSMLRRLHPAGGSVAVYSDLLATPVPGASVDGAPDLHVRGQHGDRLLSGQDGRTLLGVPPGLTLSSPARLPFGWTATCVSLATGLSAVAVIAPDGFVVPFAVLLQPTQPVVDSSGRLVFRDGAHLRVHEPGVDRSFVPGHDPWLLVLSGAGA